MSNLQAQLVHELTCAEKIILAMLKHMTVAQKCAAGVEIEEAGIAGEGMTRYHERNAVLASAAKNAEPDTATPVFCKDCKHYGAGIYPRCHAPALARIDVVTGYYGPRCRDERAPSNVDGCGQDGKLFEARRPKTQLLPSPAASDNNRSSLSSKNLDSTAMSDSTDATTASGTSRPNTEMQTSRASTSLS